MSQKYIFYIMGNPYSFRSDFCEKVFETNKNLKNVVVFSIDDIIQKISYKAVDAKKACREVFYKELKSIDFLSLYRDIQTKINKAVKEGCHIVINMDNLTYCDRNRWFVPSKYKKVCINCCTDCPIFHPQKEFYLPPEYITELKNIETPLDEKYDNTSLLYNFKDMNYNQWDTIITGLINNTFLFQK